MVDTIQHIRPEVAISKHVRDVLARSPETAVIMLLKAQMIAEASKIVSAHSSALVNSSSKREPGDQTKFGEESGCDCLNIRPPRRILYTPTAREMTGMQKNGYDCIIHASAN